MSNTIIGRKEEILLLKKSFNSIKAEFIAVYGRRRVGKTYLIHQYFLKEKCLLFHVTGKYQENMQAQLDVFTQSITKTFFEGMGIEVKSPTNWMTAFELLTNNIDKFAKGSKKVVLFFDELPWLATKRAGFLSALDYYWNTLWSKNRKIILIVCGSAASWMIKNIINNKGGLHNRITIEIPLYPFTLKESQEFLEYLGFKLNGHQILDLYMALGGVPHYLEKIQKELSIVQNISKLYFARGGALQTEFEKLFASLFDNAPAYIELINKIAIKREGVSRSNLDKGIKLSDSGGTLTDRLEALERAGFIRSFIPLGHTDKGLYYKVIDEYCLFYLQWVKPIIRQLKDEVDLSYWQAKVNTPTWKNWVGYAFESVCRKHLNQIKKALYIPSDALSGSWKYIPKQYSKEKGTQIDLLFDRSDGAISICEIKYSEKPFLIDKNYAENLLNKINIYRKQTKTKKQIILSMITTNGIKKSVYSEKMVMGMVTLEDLFKY